MNCMILQKHHWQRFEPSQKLLVMDTLFSLVKFAASYNSDINLRQRMQEITGDRYENFQIVFLSSLRRLMRFRVKI